MSKRIPEAFFVQIDNFPVSFYFASIFLLPISHNIIAITLFILFPTNQCLRRIHGFRIHSLLEDSYCIHRRHKHFLQGILQLVPSLPLEQRTVLRAASPQHACVRLAHPQPLEGPRRLVGKALRILAAGDVGKQLRQVLDFQRRQSILQHRCSTSVLHFSTNLSRCSSVNSKRAPGLLTSWDL